MLLSSWTQIAYLAYFGHFFNQSNLNLLKQQELLDLNLNELQMNKPTAHVTLPTHDTRVHLSSSWHSTFGLAM